MMRNELRRRLDRKLVRSPIQSFLESRTGGGLVVLAYHDVEDPGRLWDQIRFIKSRWRPVDQTDVLRALKGKQLPRSPIFITFDDGHRSLVETVLPMFQEHGIPAVAFVVSGLLGTDRSLWWSEVESLVSAGGVSDYIGRVAASDAVRLLKRLTDEQRVSVMQDLRSSAQVEMHGPQLSHADLRKLESGGIAIGSHTHNHPCLPRCSPERVLAEIREAHSELASALGLPPRAFAYPNGDWDPRAETVLKELGYEAAFLFDHRTNRLPISEPLRISRVRVDSTTSMDRFRMILSGLHPALHRLRGGK
jgi:peptidoglycan/xylan/chitin deacetylase (PgdA/CDA1 family)